MSAKTLEDRIAELERGHREIRKITRAHDLKEVTDDSSRELRNLKRINVIADDVLGGK